METLPEDNDVPLTKTKTVKRSELDKRSIISESVSEITEVLAPENPIKEKKPRPPKSEKQMASMKKAIEVRRANIEKRKYEKKLEASRLLLNEETLKNKKKQIKPSKAKKEELEEESESSESEESEVEVVYLKKQKALKKKSKVRIYESESESESDEEPPAPKAFGKSHQNKKSVSYKQSDQKPRKPETKVAYRNFFTD